MTEDNNESFMEISGNGNKYWKNKQGKYHRLDGPAVERADGSKDWWVDGKRHRTDGPAVERINGSKEWYIDGIELTEEEFKYWSKDLVMFKLTYS